MRINDFASDRPTVDMSYLTEEVIGQRGQGAGGCHPDVTDTTCICRVTHRSKSESSKLDCHPVDRIVHGRGTIPQYGGERMTVTLMTTMMMMNRCSIRRRGEIHDVGARFDARFGARFGARRGNRVSMSLSAPVAEAAVVGPGRLDVERRRHVPPCILPASHDDCI